MDFVVSLVSGSMGAAVVAGVFGVVMYRLQKKDKQDEMKQAERKALCYVLLYIIEERAKECLADGNITLSELRRIHHWHRVYKTLGGNGDADDLLNRLEALPIADE